MKMLCFVVLFSAYGKDFDGVLKDKGMPDLDIKKRGVCLTC